MDAVRRKDKEQAKRFAVLNKQLSSDAQYLQSALQFSETQHFMLRLPVWGDVLREVNQAVGCCCPACHWNGMVPGDSEQESAASMASLEIVESVGSPDCALQMHMLKLLARLRVSVQVADEPQLCPGVDAGALRSARTDVYLGGASVVLRNSVGTPCFFDEGGMCSGWGEPVCAYNDRRMQEMADLIAVVERLRAQRGADQRGKMKCDLHYFDFHSK